IPHDAQVIEWRRTESAIDDLGREMAERQQSDRQDAPSIYVLVYGLQRYRMLRKSEESFSFSLTDDAEKKADPGKQFAELLRDGPPAGIHIIAWADTAATLE